MTVYTKSSCAPCLALKEFLKRKRIDFIEKNILDSEYRLAPTVEIGGSVIEGYNIKRLMELISTAEIA